MMSKYIQYLLLLLIPLCGCGSHVKNSIVKYHLPGQDRYHIYVEINNNDYKVTKLYRSYHVSDPDKGVKVRVGKIDKNEFNNFISKIKKLGLDKINQKDIEKRMNSYEGRLGVADGLEFSYSIKTDDINVNFSKNGLSAYADYYKDIKELRLLMDSLGIFSEFAENLYIKGRKP